MKNYNQNLQWQKEEINYLIDNWELGSDRLSKSLKRSSNAVQSRIILLKKQGKIYASASILKKQIWYQWDIKKPNEINENQLTLF